MQLLKHHYFRNTVIALSATILLACNPSDTNRPSESDQQSSLSVTVDLQDWPKLTSQIPHNEALEDQIQSLLNNMTLEEKVGQMIQAEIKTISPTQVREYNIGSILNGGGSFPNQNKYASVKDWLDLADSYYHAAMDTKKGRNAIPLLWGTDAVHGHNNVIGATYFPHNIGLGATQNPQLVSDISRATAREVAATGIDWVFAPTVAVAQDMRWGRAYESYSEDPEIVKMLAGPAVIGLQGASPKALLKDNTVIATVKHFIGDGGTQEGIDQGNTIATELELIRSHALGYYSAIEAGAQTVMASFNSWNGSKVHGNQYLLTDVLKSKMGFDGFVIGDWNGHAQIKGCTKASCPQAINAGIDMFMAPDDWKQLLRNTIAQVNDGTIAVARIDDATRRILRVKLRAGLFDKKAPSQRKIALEKNVVGSAKHRLIARQAVRESLVLLKNDQSLLPLSPNIKVLVTGNGADNIAMQTGGWTLTWQGLENTNSDFPGGKSIFDAIQHTVNNAGGTAQLSADGSFKHAPDVAVVVFGEQPYAEGIGDKRNLLFVDSSDNYALIQQLQEANVPVVSIFLSGRPLWINREINASSAFVAAWLPGTEMLGVTDVIFTKPDGEINYNFTGRLPFAWPVLNPNNNDRSSSNGLVGPQFNLGHGLDFKNNQQKLLIAEKLNEDIDLEYTESMYASLQKPTAVDGSPYAIYDRRSIGPWKMYVGNDHNWNVAIPAAGGSTADGHEIQVVSVDKELQEDAKKVLWDSENFAQVFFQRESAIDLSEFLAMKSSLIFDIKIDKAPTHAVSIRIDCQFPCSGSVDLTQYLSQLPLGSWNQLSIDLACFEQAGTRFQHVDTPFLLGSSGQLELSVSNIRYLPSTREKADIRCDSDNFAGY